MSKQLLYLAIGYLGLAALSGDATAGDQESDVRTFLERFHLASTEKGPFGAVHTGDQEPDVNERTIQERYHIAPTEEELVGALQHKGPGVRIFAASWLADHADPAAIRPILAALETEKNDIMKIELATAAARLGSVEALRSMCSDRSSPEQRMHAAASMLWFVKRGECLPDVLEVLRSPADDHKADALALNILSSLDPIPPGQVEEIRDLSAVYMKSPWRDVRLEATSVIAALGGPWAIAQLQAALDAESEKDVRNAIEANPRYLQQRHKLP